MKAKNILALGVAVAGLVGISSCAAHEETKAHIYEFAKWFVAYRWDGVYREGDTMVYRGAMAFKRTSVPKTDMLYFDSPSGQIDKIEVLIDFGRDGSVDALGIADRFMSVPEPVIQYLRDTTTEEGFIELDKQLAQAKIEVGIQ
ncbi:MAG: hypothetical protein V1734_04355 [Nanoarchaeota archaeon]